MRESHLKNSILVAKGKKLSVVAGDWLLVTGNWLLVIGDSLLVIGNWLLVICDWLLVTGNWLLVNGLMTDNWFRSAYVLGEMIFTAPAGSGIIWRRTRPRKTERRMMGIRNWLFVNRDLLAVIRDDR